jgi:hypothetical protein
MDHPFDPQGMQSIIDRLKAEGRMPSPELLRQVMAETRAEYQKTVKVAQARDRRRREMGSKKR